MKILENSSLKFHHTFGLNINAKQVIEAYDKNDFIQIWQAYPNESKLILGEGSNVLFCEDFAGI